MQNFVIIFLTLVCAGLGGWLISLYIRYKKLKQTFRNHKKMLRSVTKTINSVRYGNLYERIPKETFSILPNLSQSVDSMIEAIVDREDMIKEYQSELNQKIDVLTEVEKLKEDFVATLTHDLKVPILAEKNMLNFLLNNRFGELNERQKEAISYLTGSNNELVELVESCLKPAQSVLPFSRGLDLLDGCVDYRIDLREVLFEVALRNLEKASLGLL